jgi:hypothetical protein
VLTRAFATVALGQVPGAPLVLAYDGAGEGGWEADVGDGAAADMLVALGFAPELTTGGLTDPGLTAGGFTVPGVAAGWFTVPGLTAGGFTVVAA